MKFNINILIVLAFQPQQSQKVPFMSFLSKLHTETALCSAGIEILPMIEGQYIHVKHDSDIK